MKNFIKRALTGIIFVAVLVGAICYDSISFLIVFGLITGLTVWEFNGLVKQEKTTPSKRFISALGGVYLFAATFAFANELTDGFIFLPYLLFIIYLMVGELYYQAKNPIYNWSTTLFAQVYVAGTFSMLNFIAALPDTPGEIAYSPLYILAIFVFIWLNDTGAYLVGSLIGKRRLFERISPKKSWEGFFGGLAIAMGASQLIAMYTPDVNNWQWLGLSATIVIFGTWGDLIESLLKRTLGVKDSGNILPGHGGMLDRFDSMILAAPAAFIYIEAFIRN